MQLLFYFWIKTLFCFFTLCSSLLRTAVFGVGYGRNVSSDLFVNTSQPVSVMRMMCSH